MRRHATRCVARVESERMALGGVHAECATSRSRNWWGRARCGPARFRAWSSVRRVGALTAIARTACVDHPE